MKDSSQWEQEARLGEEISNGHSDQWSSICSDHCHLRSSLMAAETPAVSHSH